MRKKSSKHGFFDNLGHNVSTPVENVRQIAPFLCKTNPISKMLKLTHTLFYKELTKIFAHSATQKTNPKRTQTKPISKNAKMNAYSFMQRTYDEILHFFSRKNEAKTNPISKTPKMNINHFYTKDYKNDPR